MVEGNKRKREEARSATSDGAFSFFAELLLQRYGSRLRVRPSILDIHQSLHYEYDYPLVREK